MGAKDSKLSFLSYEDACPRVTEDELKRLEHTFKVKTGSQGQLSKQLLCSEVLGEPVPKKLAEAIFLAAGGQTKGMGFREVLVVLVLISKGTTEEKTMFLFTLISMDGISVTQEDMVNFYALCDDDTNIPSVFYHPPFVDGVKVSLEVFQQWIVVNTDFCCATRWLLESEQKLSSDVVAPSFYNSLASITSLEVVDIIEIEKRYLELKSTSGTGRFDYETFCAQVSPPFPQKFLKGFYGQFDKNNDNNVDLKEMVCAISTFCQGALTEKLKFCFGVFDQGNDGILCDHERNEMVELLMQLNTEKCSAAESTELSGQTDGISFPVFEKWANTNLHLLEDFFILVSQVCHIIFGLKPKSKFEEGRIVRHWMERDRSRELETSLLYYIISIDWWKSWLEETVPNTNGVGPHGKSNGTKNKEDGPTSLNSIDNSTLLTPQTHKHLSHLTGEGGRLKSDVQKDHFEVVSAPVWRAISTWYGTTHILPRMANKNKDEEHVTLELYPIRIFLYKHTPPAKSLGLSLNAAGINNLLSMLFGNNSQQQQQQMNLVPPKRTLSYTASFSRRYTIRQILEFLSTKIKSNTDDFRLWKMNEKEPVLIEEEEKTVEELKITDGCHLLLEIRNEDLSWPEEMNALISTRTFRQRSNTGVLEKGATGLHNLGNTCYMNSAIQCLMNTQPLTQYFLAKLFLYELNKTNPLGMKGVLAKRYGDLAADLWSGYYRSIAPVKLRLTIGQYAPRFNGFQQHDSQELLSFLLDGLHEDLNRVHEKPYIELKDSDGRPDCEVACEAWESHIKRNQSIIVDLFQGQLKSLVRCMHCDRVSVRFDPFTFLSLPLSMENSVHLIIPVFSSHTTAGKQYGLILPNTATVLELKKQLSKLCCVPLESLLLVQVVGGRPQNFPCDSSTVQASSSLYAYEVNPSSLDTIPPIVVETTLNTSASMSSVSNNQSSRSKRRFGKHLPRFRSHKGGEKIHPVATVTQPVATVTQQVAAVTHPVATSDSLEVPGVLSTSFSPTRTISSSSSVGCLSPDTLVVAMNRKTLHTQNYFFAWQMSRPMLFGVPIIFSCSPTMTNRQMYDYVWQRVSRLVTLDTAYGDGVYPFELSLVTKDAVYCAVCPWYSFCRGCKIVANDETSLCSQYLVIDWDTTILHLYYQHSMEKQFEEDDSVQTSYELLRQPVCLDKCLTDFTREEQLGESETWYCSQCKEHRQIAKKIDLWSLPPILVVHVKRFHMVNKRWVKSNKRVNFPFTGFDPGKYLVQSSTEQINSEEKPSNEETKPQPTYDLYAISCHSGLLSAGHYITYAKGAKGHWYCYNDSTCKEVEQNILENETPYILFYQRHNLDCISYMPDTKGRQPISVQLEEEQFERDVKKHCVVM